MALPTKAILTALVATAAVGLASEVGSNQLVPGVDANTNVQKIPAKTVIGVKALALSAGLAGACLVAGGLGQRNTIGRGLLYAAGLSAVVGTGLIAQSQFQANAKALAGG